jgi:predicted ABC-type transport system involved in lysophospholipase L1 biosynthesis ATPase subunit
MKLLLGHVSARQTTLILVTHDEELAGRSADRIVWLRDGQLATKG